MENNTVDNVLTLPGIDTLYYFCETNETYDNLFQNIKGEVDSQKEKFYTQKEQFTKSDIRLSINDEALSYLGNQEGFFWFTDKNEFVKIGFKDPWKNRALNNIRIQFKASGIYTIGIKSLLEYVNDNLLKGHVTGVYPITRLDLNIFVQTDLSDIDKTMFVSKKQHHSQIFQEIGNAYEIQTLYVGSKPFLLRLYDKQAEMKKSSKNELMQEYFANNGFDLEKPIYNIEFEMHREHLKQYKINTVDDALENAENLFKEALKLIRMIDTSKLTETDLKHNKRFKADTHPLWVQIENGYNLKDFYQTTTPIERIKKTNYAFTIDRFFDEAVFLVKKAMASELSIGLDFFQEVLKASGKMMHITDPNLKKVIPIQCTDNEGCTVEYDLRIDTIDPVLLQRPLKTISSHELITREREYRKAFQHGVLSKQLLNLYTTTYTELERRDLVQALPMF